MNCTCLDAVLQQARDRALDLAPKHQTHTFSIAWQNAFFMAGQPSDDNCAHGITLPVKIKYRREHKGGTPYPTSTQRTMHIFMAYCPFCGEATGQEGMQDGF